MSSQRCAATRTHTSTHARTHTHTHTHTHTQWPRYPLFSLTSPSRLPPSPHPSRTYAHRKAHSNHLLHTSHARPRCAHSFRTRRFFAPFSSPVQLETSPWKDSFRRQRLLHLLVFFPFIFFASNVSLNNVLHRHHTRCLCESRAHLLPWGPCAAPSVQACALAWWRLRFGFCKALTVYVVGF